MANEMTRTFVAADPPQSVKANLAEAVEPLRRKYRVRWTRPVGWHITLEFLGDCTPDEVKAVIACAEESARRTRPFEASLGGWGVFPNPSRPRVLWLGVTKGAAQLVRVAESLGEHLARSGFHRDKKSFHPHLTIARVNERRAGVEALSGLRRLPAPTETFPVDHIVVYRSVLDRAGAEYHPLAECPFTANA